MENLHRSSIFFLPAEIRVKAVADELLDRDGALRHLKEHRARAQDYMVRSANKYRRNVLFDVGQKVFLKFRPYRQQSLFKRTNVKLAAKYYGPFAIVERLGAVAHLLQLPEGSRLHPIFHKALL